MAKPGPEALLMATLPVGQSQALSPDQECTLTSPAERCDTFFTKNKDALFQSDACQNPQMSSSPCFNVGVLQDAGKHAVPPHPGEAEKAASICPHEGNPRKWYRSPAPPTPAPWHEWSSAPTRPLADVAYLPFCRSLPSLCPCCCVIANLQL